MSYLNDSHVEPRLLSQLLPDVPGGFGGSRKSSLEGLQLLGLDGGAWSSPLGPRVLLLILVVGGLFVG